LASYFHFSFTLLGEREETQAQIGS
jgi:hypothetical protein